ncbi:MAG TPA: hypothetical protein VI956_07885 [Nitrospirota bacterium]|nr:hypothetical protein [Nitrospirota bacterium]
MDEMEDIKVEQGGETASPDEGDVQPESQEKNRIVRKPTAFEKRVEARAMDRVVKALESRPEPAPLTDPVAGSPEEPAPVSGPEDAGSSVKSMEGVATPPATARNGDSAEAADAASAFRAALRLLQGSEVGSSPKALRLLADLAELAQGGAPTPQSRASHVIQPSGGGLPAPDLRAEYEKRVGELRPGDIAGLMELKREFRKRGMEVW